MENLIIMEFLRNKHGDLSATDYINEIADFLMHSEKLSQVAKLMRSERTAKYLVFSYFGRRQPDLISFEDFLNHAEELLKEMKLLPKFMKKEIIARYKNKFEEKFLGIF